MQTPFVDLLLRETGAIDELYTYEQPGFLEKVFSAAVGVPPLPQILPGNGETYPVLSLEDYNTEEPEEYMFEEQVAAGYENSIPSSKLDNMRYGSPHEWANSAENLAIRKKVYEQHVANSRTANNPYTYLLDKTQAREVDNSGKTLLNEAADWLDQLLAAARAALSGKNVKIRILSGYRTADYQFDNWVEKFPTYFYWAVHKAGISKNDINGIARYISKSLAAPGYSNHNHGLAVDFGATESSNKFTVDTNPDHNHKKFWETKSLFWDWLTKNAARFNFYPYAKEPWHWEFRSPAGGAAAAPRITAEVVETNWKQSAAYNKTYASRLGWSNKITAIAELLLKTTGQSNSSYTSEEFAKLVAVWQVKNGVTGKSADGVIGPNTWKMMQAKLGIATATTATPAGVEPRVVAKLQQYSDLIESISKQFQLNPNIPRGIIAAESGGNPLEGQGEERAYKGLMQAQRGDDQLDPQKSIETGIGNFIDFRDKYLGPRLSKLGIDTRTLDDQTLLKIILCGYNVGHIGILKAIQYAKEEGDWKNWFEARHYQRGILFSGSYSKYPSCGQTDIDKANKDAAFYKFKKASTWQTEPDPPKWEVVSTSISPLLRCWIETRYKNTPGYLARILNYYNYFESIKSGKQNESAEDYVDESYENYPVDEYDSETGEGWAGGEEDYSYLSESGDQYEIDDELQEQQLAQVPAPPGTGTCAVPAVSASSTPPFIAEDLSVAGYTCYVKIDLGKGNIRLDMTGIYIPSSFTPAEPVDLLIYLHGMTGEFPGKEAKIDSYWKASRLPNYDYRLREEVEASGKNIILAAPSLGKSPNSYRNSLSDKKGGLDEYVIKIIAAVQSYILAKRFSGGALNLRNIILAGHSAGGRQLLKIATTDNPLYGCFVSEYWGFDSLYSGNSEWKVWAKSNPGKRLFIYYLGSTKDNAVALQKTTAAMPGIFIKKSTAKKHALVPKEHLKERILKIGQSGLTKTSFEMPEYEEDETLVLDPENQYEQDEYMDEREGAGPENNEDYENDPFQQEAYEHNNFFHLAQPINAMGSESTDEYMYEEMLDQQVADWSNAIRQNRYYAAKLQWEQYHDQINDLLLPYSGQQNVSLDEESFAQAVAAWQLGQGFSASESDGIIGPHTWAKMKVLLNSPVTVSPPAAIGTTAPPVQQIFNFNRWHAQKILNSMNAGLTGSNFNSMDQLKKIVLGQRVLNIDPQRTIIQVLPLIYHITEQARLNNNTDIIIGSFIRPPKSDGSCTGHCAGRCIDINYKGGGFQTIGSVTMVTNILNYLLSLPAQYKKNLGFGMPMQGGFYGNKNLTKGSKTSASLLIDAGLRSLVPQLGMVFPDNDNHLHIQVRWK